MLSESSDADLLFDAQFVSVDHDRRVATFASRGLTYSRRLDFPAFWTPGTVGLLNLPHHDDSFAFHSYPDQRLRRLPELDSPDQAHWGWCIDQYRFTAKRGILPGVAGAVIWDECRSMPLRIPPEWDRWCEHHQVDPAGVLCNFIADLCAISDSRRRPREDGYCSSGTHGRFLAREYFRLVYPNLRVGNTAPAAQSVWRDVVRDA